MHNKSAFLLAVTLFIGVFSLSQPAMAREVKYKDFNFDIRNGDKLFLVGLKGSVKLIATAKALSKGTGEGVGAAEGSGNGLLRVRKNGGTGAAADAFDQWTFTVRRDGNQVKIEAKGPESKSDWENQLKKALIPELHFEVEIPAAAPAEIALRDGTITAQGWKSPLSLQVIDGQIRISKSEGAVRAQAQKGEIRIDTHKGRVEVDGFSPKINLTQLEGELSLDNFSGETNVQGLKGRLNVRSFSGQTAVTKAEGGVDFELVRGSLTYQGAGSVRGQLENGTVTARVSGDPEVNIEAQSGSVNVDIEPGASPSVKLQSEDGALNAPGDLPSTRVGNGRVVSGKLNGGGQGSVFIKTKSGNVRVF